MVPSLRLRYPDVETQGSPGSNLVEKGRVRELEPASLPASLSLRSLSPLFPSLTFSLSPQRH